MGVLLVGASQDDLALLIQTLLKLEPLGWALLESGKWARKMGSTNLAIDLTVAGHKTFTGRSYSEIVISTNVSQVLSEQLSHRLEAEGQIRTIKPLDPKFDEVRDIAKTILELSQPLIAKAVSGLLIGNVLKLYYPRTQFDPYLGEIYSNSFFLESKPIDNGLVAHSFTVPISPDDYLAVSQATDRAIRLILDERIRADNLHGQMPRGQTKVYWLTALVEEIGEVARAIQDEGDYEYEAELTQVAALAIAAIIELTLENRTQKTDG